MGKNTSIILGDHFEKFIQSELDSGRYASASEVIRTGLRLLEDERTKIEAINKALKEGEESGLIRKFSNEEFKAKMKKRIKANG